MNRLFAVFCVLFLFSANLYADEKKIEVKWLGHAAFQITTLSGKTILIDPFLTTNPKTPAKLKNFTNYQNIDVIFITHGHADHVGDAIALSSKFDIPVYAPPGLNDTFVSLGLLPSKFAPRFNKGGSIFPVGEDIKITMTHAEHSSEFKWKNDDSGKTEIHEGGEPVGYIIRLENGFTIYHMGDTGLFGDLAFIGQYYKPDLVLMPIGGHFVMDPVDAAYAVKEYLKPKYVVPMHYGTFPVLKGTVAEFNKALNGEATWVFDMVPGDTIKF